MQVTKNDIKRASFQYDGGFALFRWVMETQGNHEYRHESFRGELINSVLNSKRPFTEYVKARVSNILKEIEDE